MNSARAQAGYDVERVRSDFPALASRVHGRPLVYLDSAATAQRPSAVLEAMDAYHRRFNANVHRGVYAHSEEATARYEAVRGILARHFGVEEPQRVVFTKGCTEAVNLVAHAWLEPRLGAGDRVLVSRMEHHSNLVPWQLVCERRGARVLPIPMDGAGDLDLEAFDGLLSEGAALVAVTQVSNALGTVNPIAEIVRRAHRAGAVVLVDGAQAAPHLAVDVEALGADFFALSGHKMLGPTGVGALIARTEHLEAMGPWQGGGDMIREVSFEGTTFADGPQRFEAGTPPIAGVIGLGAAVEYLDRLGMSDLTAHEHALLQRALDRLTEVEGLRVIGRPRLRAAVVPFVVEGTHPQDLATLLDQQGVAVRTGHHCAQPALRHFGLDSTVRASFGPFNTAAEVDVLVEALVRARRILTA